MIRQKENSRIKGDRLIINKPHNDTLFERYSQEFFIILDFYLFISDICFKKIFQAY
jgi:hypothetical protein